MRNKIERISIDKLIEHPDNANVMSKENFARLVRNIERCGRYEPIVVRRFEGGSYQIINGHHRVRALKKIGSKEADCVVWDVDEAEARVLLATLNRLSGSDKLSKKISLLKKLSREQSSKELAKILPQTSKEIERLVNYRLPKKLNIGEVGRFCEPLVFFVGAEQKKVIEEALSLTDSAGRTGAEKRSAGLVKLAENFIEGEH